MKNIYLEVKIEGDADLADVIREMWSLSKTIGIPVHATFNGCKDLVVSPDATEYEIEKYIYELETH